MLQTWRISLNRGCDSNILLSMCAETKHYCVKLSTKLNCIKSWYYLMAEAYLKLCQTSKMELFVKIWNGFQLLTIFVKRSILNIWQGSEYDSAWFTHSLPFTDKFQHSLLKWGCKYCKWRYTYLIKSPELEYSTSLRDKSLLERNFSFSQLEAFIFT